MTPDSPASAKPGTAKNRRRISLRVFLSLLLLSLSLVTVGGTGFIAYKHSYNSLTKLKEQEFAIKNRAAASEIGRLLDEPAHRIFGEYTHKAQIGQLPLHDTLALGQEFAERLRARPQLAWISYSDAKTGDFTGAWRARNGDVILNRSSPRVNGSIGVNALVALDGQLTPYPNKEPAAYDPRKTDWYARAANSDATAWSEPYDFADGQFGITASRAWRVDGSTTAAGVFTVDFLLDELDSEINEISTQQQDLENENAQPAPGKPKDFLCVFEPDGTLLCAPQEYRRQKFAATLSGLVRIASTGGNSTEYNRIFNVTQDGGRYMVALHFVNTPEGFRCVVASLAETSQVYAEADRTALFIATSGLLLLCVALAFGWGIARRISRPLSILSADLQKIGDLDLTSGPLKNSIFRELQILIDSSERMKSGLRSFLHYVPTQLVRQLLHSGRDATLGVQPKRLTILFSDIENFTAYSEHTPPARIVDDLSGYFEIFTREVWRHSGTIDKFIGDGILAFFNAPLDIPAHERLACETAIAAIEALKSASDKIPFRTRIGLHTGEVLVGNVGTHERFAYTILGDAVNTASRIESLNKIYGTHILASEDVREKAGDNFEWRHLDLVAVAGRKSSLHLHELLGTKDNTVDPKLLQARDLYEQALAHYFAKDLTTACDLFTQAAAARPEDRAAAMMVQRCNDLIANRPGENWDGVFVHTHK